MTRPSPTGVPPEKSAAATAVYPEYSVATLAKEQPKRAFTSLARHIDEAWLREAYAQTRRDGSPGVDGQTARMYAEDLHDNFRSLLNRAKSGTYKAPPVRRVYIPKGRGDERRPIGIPTLEDKVLQRAVTMVLESVYEQDFYPGSYGFRPSRSAHQALSSLREQVMAMGGCWVVELDIRSFLETSSYYTPFHEGWSKSPGWLSKTLIRKPLRFPRRTCTAASSPRFTRCKTVWRETPRIRIALNMST